MSNINSEFIFILYVRDKCHLCEQMLVELEANLVNQKYHVEVIDIDTDPELQRQHAGQIPVLTYQGTVLCEYFFDSKVLESILISAR